MSKMGSISPHPSLPPTVRSTKFLEEGRGRGGGGGEREACENRCRLQLLSTHISRRHLLCSGTMYDVLDRGVRITTVLMEL